MPRKKFANRVNNNKYGGFSQSGQCSKKFLDGFAKILRIIRALNIRERRAKNICERLEHTHRHTKVCEIFEMYYSRWGQKCGEKRNKTRVVRGRFLNFNIVYLRLLTYERRVRNMQKPFAPIRHNAVWPDPDTGAKIGPTGLCPNSLPINRSSSSKTNGCLINAITSQLHLSLLCGSGTTLPELKLCDRNNLTAMAPSGIGFYWRCGCGLFRITFVPR